MLHYYINKSLGNGISRAFIYEYKKLTKMIDIKFKNMVYLKLLYYGKICLLLQYGRRHVKIFLINNYKKTGVKRQWKKTGYVL